MNDDSPVVLCGANGFLGSTMATRLRAESRIVVPVSRRRPLTSIALREIEPAAIVWLAGSVTPLVASQDPPRCEEELSEFVRSIEQIGEHAPNSRFLFASSGGAIYSSPPPHAETSEVKAHSAFGEMRLAMEEEARRLSNSTALRISNVYGPGQQPRRGLGVVAHWLWSASAGLPLDVFGDADTERDFVYVDDVVESLSKMLESDTELPSILNIGSGSPTRLFDLLDLVRGIVDPLPLDVVHHPLRSEVDRRSYYLDVSMAAEILDWRPKTALEVGIAKTWDHFRSPPKPTGPPTGGDAVPPVS